MGETGNGGEKSIKVKSVKGFTTFFDFDPKTPDYRNFLIARDAYRQTQKHGESEPLRKAAEEHFIYFIDNYLKAAGLSSSKNSFKILPEPVENIVLVYMEGTKIIPGRERYLDGYFPRLEFEARERSLRAKAALRQDGTDDVRVLEDILKLAPKGDGMLTPRLGFGAPEIQVASIEKIPEVLDAMKRIYGYVGESEFRELTQMRGSINALRNNVAGQQILREEYTRRIGSLLLENLFS
ncbi:hypothetical protein HY212_04855 [Candidatus Pacearchaeota archaeon]|nr:hypothetical protein [Candidatus Pacearchaeota archaeon]